MPQVVTKPNNRQLEFDENRISIYADRILADLPMLDKEKLVRGVNAKLRREEVSGEEISSAFSMSALELVTKEEPNWKFAAARSLLTSLYKKAANNRRYKAYTDKPYGAFQPLITSMVKKASTAKNCSNAIPKNKLKILDVRLNREMTCCLITSDCLR